RGGADRGGGGEHSSGQDGGGKDRGKSTSLRGCHGVSPGMAGERVGKTDAPRGRSPASRFSGNRGAGVKEPPASGALPTVRLVRPGRRGRGRLPPGPR